MRSRADIGSFFPSSSSWRILSWCSRSSLSRPRAARAIPISRAMPSSSRSTSTSWPSALIRRLKRYGSFLGSSVSSATGRAVPESGLTNFPSGPFFGSGLAAGFAATGATLGFGLGGSAGFCGPVAPLAFPLGVAVTFPAAGAALGASMCVPLVVDGYWSGGGGRAALGCIIGSAACGGGGAGGRGGSAGAPPGWARTSPVSSPPSGGAPGA